jgi:ABC-type multidrug transport system fused ATPase/permease subunit
MNGMAASDKIFHLLDLPEESQEGKQPVPDTCSICCQHVSFSYEEDREILQDVNIVLPQGSFIAIVGESGSGKSTLGGILMGRNKQYQGSIQIGGIELHDIAEDSLLQNFTYISHQSYLFKGTVRDNLQMGCPEAAEQDMWDALEKAKLAEFLRGEQGLDTPLTERASNLSGGQRQRLALARALLHDSPVYIFDEATSNIDVDSENDIMEQIMVLAETKTVLLIAHRLANVVSADRIYVMAHGSIVESGTHSELLAKKGTYEALWSAQQSLENYGKDGK